MLVTVLFYLMGNWFASLSVWNLEKDSRIISYFNKTFKKKWEYGNVYENLNDMDA